MEKPAFALYTANPADAGFRSLATLLSQQQPVTLSPLTELPPPDRQRPTRQQLRSERAELTRAVEQDRRLLRLTGPHAGRFPQEVAALHADITRCEQRLQAIAAQLGEEGGLLDG
ncbi:hypothetical protein ACFPAF_17060 [Hymenobacter endophyticus]|uniref:Uncharacterized protein n=1 Tax=Hymenobacter endophyticus TaxID=3076335 RepID=A0ABU3TL70_9BACT|nr:hypothetical protein [Hymenobacter endophyticus]MDU0372115.1 hypothetical protein [Hymenobacter endophyticus]